MENVHVRKIRQGHGKRCIEGTARNWAGEHMLLYGTHSGTSSVMEMPSPSSDGGGGDFDEVNVNVVASSSCFLRGTCTGILNDDLLTGDGMSTYRWVPIQRHLLDLVYSCFLVFGVAYNRYREYTKIDDVSAP